MVALKLSKGVANRSTPCSKQERRGGIETPARREGTPPGRPRSRNAVVALKLVSSCVSAQNLSRKQERRGGIETCAKSLERRRFNEKQERRGGIETTAN